MLIRQITMAVQLELNATILFYFNHSRNWTTLTTQSLSYDSNSRNSTTLTTQSLNNSNSRNANNSTFRLLLTSRLTLISRFTHSDLLVNTL